MLEMPTWMRASRVYRVRVRLFRVFLVAAAATFGGSALAVLIGVPPVAIKYGAWSLMAVAMVAFLASTVLAFGTRVPAHDWQHRTAVTLMLYRDVFAGIPPYVPPGKPLPTMRWN